MNKRFASLAVSALLLVSLLSVPALAEGTEAAADAAGDDHVIVTPVSYTHLRAHET